MVRYCTLYSEGKIEGSVRYEHENDRGYSDGVIYNICNSFNNFNSGRGIMMSEVSNIYILKVVSSISVVIISGVIGLILVTGDVEMPFKLLGVILLLSSALTMLGVYLSSKFWETKGR